MTPGITFLEQHKLALEALCKQYGVERMYAFGSVVNENFTEKSDVDLLVKFDHEGYGEEFLDLYMKLGDLFKRNVDLLTVDQLRNPYFIKELNNTAKRIYGK